MNQISPAQWNVFFLICTVVVVGLTVATYVICRVLMRVVRAESVRIEQEWKKQRQHDQQVMMAESERLLQATAARRALFDNVLDSILPEESRDPLGEK